MEASANVLGKVRWPLDRDAQKCSMNCHYEISTPLRSLVFA